MTSLFALTADSTFTIYTTEIEQINTRDQASQYNKFLKKIERGTPYKFNLEFLPMNRGLRGFNKNPQSCIFPFSVGDKVEVPKNMVLSEPLGTIELFAINRKDQKLVTKNNILKKTRVALRAMYKEGLVLDKNIEYFFVTSEKQLFLMLEKKRVDYILASVPDIFLSFEGGRKEFSSLYQFDKKMVVKELNEHMACHQGNVNVTRLFKYLKSL